MKRYGIYLAYPPQVDLRHEGLGRYLASFVRGGKQLPDVEFIIACPSWSQASLADLLKSEGLAADVAIICPSGKPYLLHAYEACLRLSQWKQRRSPSANRLLKALQRRCADFQRRLAQAHDFPSMIPVLTAGLQMMMVLLCCLPLMGLKACAAALRWLIKRACRPFSSKLTAWLGRLANAPKNSHWVLTLFKSLNEAESLRMRALIEARDDVVAWYSPTAFWPAFNDLQVPRLMCVPDVVLTDFSIGFCHIGGDRFLDTFHMVERAIQGAENLVTYSGETKWRTLVDHYGIPASRIDVIEHAPNTLNHLIDVDGFAHPEATSRTFCQRLLLGALRRTHSRYAASFMNNEVRFLFYASQVRPNKNLLTLLRAFEYLTHERKSGLKLILTGDLAASPQLQAFIDRHRLQADVICLRKLSITELAACYRLAELAVNPSLSEGGCPFTFTEALSVGTPVVMSRIPVTQEVLTDPQLQEVTLFDPYNWRDVAERIEWALQNRAQLLAQQQQTYAQLITRTWANVVEEHIDLLDAIAARENTKPVSPSKGHPDAARTRTTA